MHSVLLHRRTYQLAAFTKSYYWNASQLHLLVNLALMIATLTQKHRGIPDIAAEIYGRNCAEEFDFKTVEAITKIVLMSSEQLQKVNSHFSWFILYQLSKHSIARNCAVAVMTEKA